jgi:hypothetical protein
MNKPINIDDDLLSTDWIKTSSWDLPTDAEYFQDTYSDDWRDALSKLPAWQAAPASLKNKMKKHQSGTHDQESHGNWARGFTEDLKNFDPKAPVATSPRNAGGVTERMWWAWEKGPDGNNYVELYRKYAAEVLGLPIPENTGYERGGYRDYMLERGWGAPTKAKTEAFLNAISNSQPQPTLYRGIGQYATQAPEERETFETFANVKKGDQLDMVMASTTRSLGVAAWYAANRSGFPYETDRGKILIKIQAGAKGWSPSKKQAWWPDDHEVVTSGKFEVVNVEKVKTPFWFRQPYEVRRLAYRGGNEEVPESQINYQISDFSTGLAELNDYIPSAEGGRKIYDAMMANDMSQYETPTKKIVRRSDTNIANGHVWTLREPTEFTIIEMKMIEPHAVKKANDFGNDFYWLFEETPFIRDVKLEKHQSGSHDQLSHGNWATGIDPEVGQKVRQFTQEWGGLSINMVDGSMPDKGYMVAKPPQFGEVVDAADFLNPSRGDKILSAYMRRHKADLSTGKNYLGTWLNEGKVYLDVSQNVQQRETAVRLGRERNQKAIWDVVNMVEIETGGTGAAEKASRHGGIEEFERYDRRRDRRVRQGYLQENGFSYEGTSSQTGLDKHFSHEQRDHGNWARGKSSLPAVENPKANRSPEINQIAQDIRKRRAADEPKVTQDMMTLAEKYGGNMVDLQYRLKSEKSIARKVEADAQEKRITPQKAAEDMSDVIRYTMQFDTDGYTRGVQGTIAGLQEAGYTIDESRVKNFWEPIDGYQGLNAKMRHPNGYEIELQFHTPESSRVKANTHAVYEVYRETNNPQQRYKLYDRMRRIARRATTPSGALAIGLPAVIPLVVGGKEFLLKMLKKRFLK